MDLVKSSAQRPLVSRLSSFSFSLGLALTIGLAGAEASAQELTHRFINPSFGGNPFYSDHLLSIANIHRPKEPQAPAEDPPSEEDLIASQIRARLLSQLSGDVLDRIDAAKPGESGEFVFGNQRINFTRGQTETRVTFTNLTTGETRELVIPVRQASGGLFGSSGARLSAEQSLGATGAMPAAPLTGLTGVSPLGTRW